jgi:hypothetical protein
MEVKKNKSIFIRVLNKMTFYHIFLLLLVVEGLIGVTRKAVEVHRFKGFEIGDQGVIIFHFNMWMILCLFEKRQWQICGLYEDYLRSFNF